MTGRAPYNARLILITTNGHTVRTRTVHDPRDHQHSYFAAVYRAGAVRVGVQPDVTVVATNHTGREIGRLG